MWFKKFAKKLLILFSELRFANKQDVDAELSAGIPLRRLPTRGETHFCALRVRLFPRFDLSTAYGPPVARYINYLCVSLSAEGASENT